MVKRTKKRKKSRKNKTKKVYDKNDFSSGEGMLTSVWGPSLWHFLHTMSFNYPTNPNKKHQNQYRNLLRNHLSSHFPKGKQKRCRFLSRSSQ